MKLKRIPAHSIVVSSVIIVLLSIVLLSAVGVFNSASQLGGSSSYMLAAIAAITTLVALGLLAAFISMRNQVCQNMQCAFNPVYRQEDFGLDFANIETPVEFMTGAFASSQSDDITPTFENTATIESTPTTGNILTAEECDDSQATQNLNLSANYGYPVRDSSDSGGYATMDFTIDMIQQVLAALQQAQAQTAVQTEIAPGCIDPEYSEKDGATTRLLLSDRLAGFLGSEIGTSALTSENAGNVSGEAKGTKGYRGAHFKSDVTLESDVEPLFTVLPRMRHARKVQLQQVEKVG